MNDTIPAPPPFRPLRDAVLISRVGDDNGEQVRPSGLIIPRTVKKDPIFEGVVLATGPGSTNKGVHFPVEVKPGDRIVYSPHGGTDVAIDGKKYVIVRAYDVLAIME
jgi:chaperonin GroES